MPAHGSARYLSLGGILLNAHTVGARDKPGLRRVILALCLLAAAAVLSGCTDSNEAFIQGNWLNSSPSVGGVTTESSVHTFWHFEDGSVDANSCCESRPGMVGRYRVVESEDDVLILNLYDIEDETGLQSYELRIKIDRERETLFLQGAGPFIRVAP
jgi:hypothetical protein